MYEGFKVNSEHFVLPDVDTEHGEFDRVAKEFDVDTETLIFLAKEDGKLMVLDDQIWSNLENTDSNRFKKSDWDSVREYSGGRDWQDLKNKIEQGVQVDAPIIMKFDSRYHLVSGNTRLMIARAAGITPKVLLFEYTVDRTHEEES